MDFGNAVLLVTAVFGIVELIKHLLPFRAVSNSSIIVGIVIAVSFAVVFLVAETFWASEQVIGSQTLDKASTWDKILISLFLAGVAAFGDKLLNAVKNIGQNQLPGVGGNAWDRTKRRDHTVPESSGSLGPVVPMTASSPVTSTGTATLNSTPAANPFGGDYDTSVPEGVEEASTEPPEV